ncbi:hypothetical protein TSMG0164 [Halocynthia phage JM-2012]|uniref:major head protein n=1 Tax=Halocynthia phage JM-2012 TaxID=1173297 RepID=UPI00025C6986|nr:major head protein [Halocynthia phage JM-2012]AFI55447.1 hypothetical protein TSMG0164 [Halocynthia phage JM-2012]
MALFNLMSKAAKSTTGVDIGLLTQTINDNQASLVDNGISAQYVGIESEGKVTSEVAVSLGNQFDTIKNTLRSAMPNVGEVGLENASRTFMMLGDADNLAKRIQSVPGLEAFSKTNLGAYRETMVAANGMVANQASLVDTLYPVIEVGANYGGVEVTLKRFTLVTNPNITANGGAVDFKRRHILDAYRDSSILNNQGNVLRPVVVTGDNEDKFVDAALLAPVTIPDTDLKTAPLKLFSTKDSLLALSRLPGASANDRSTYNDRIDDGGRIKTIYFQIGEDKTGAGGNDERALYPVPLSMFNQAQFLRGSNTGDSSDVSSTIDSDALPIDLTSTKAQSVVALKALADMDYTRLTLEYTLNTKLNLNSGNITQTASPVVTVSGLYKAGDDTNYVSDASVSTELAAIVPEFAGQDFDLTLSSKTLRLQGRRVDDQEIPFTFATTARSVITADKALDESDVSDLLSAMTATEVIDRELVAVKHLMATIDDLHAAYGEGGHNVNPIGTSMPGLAYLVKPWVKVEEVNAADFIDSEKSSERFYDIASALIQRLADNACTALTETAYVESKRMYTNDKSAKAEFAVLTSRAIGRYLYTEGDDRSFGAMSDDLEDKPQIVTSGLKEVDDTLIMVPTSSDASKGSFDPFAWGNTLRNPSLVYDVEISADGGAKRHLQLQPVYELTVNAPIVYKLKMNGLTELLASKVAKKTV